MVTVNRVVVGTYPAAGPGTVPRIAVHGPGGNDRIAIAPKVATPVELYGDGGNDVLTGGPGNDVLAGAAGPTGASRGARAGHTGGC